MENKIKKNVIKMWKDFKNSLTYKDGCFSADKELTIKINEVLKLLEKAVSTNLYLPGDPKLKYYKARIGEWYKPEDIRMPTEKYADIIKAGRFNPDKVIYFYVANKPKATIAESRAERKIGNIVTIGIFQEIQVQRFIDLRFIYKNQEDKYVKWLLSNSTEEQRAFLNILTNQISKRVENSIEYVPTQYIFEYVKKHIKKVYGFKYISSLVEEQKYWQNYVYFDDKNFELLGLEYYKFDGNEWIKYKELSM